MFDQWRAMPIEEGTSEEVTVSVPGRPERFGGSDGVTYRSTFDDPRESEDEVAILELSGAFAHCEIEVTGTLIGGDWPVEHDAYFVPIRIPFIPATDEDNDVVISCYEPRDRFGGVFDSDLVPEEQSVPGVWWDVSLESSPLPYLESVDVVPKFDGDDGLLDVRTTVVTREPVDASVTYSVKPEGELKTRGMMQRGQIEATRGGRTTVEHEVEVRDPARWWPREFGDQNRYTLRAKFEDTERTVTTGFCDVQYDDGSLLVNDVPFPINGVNLLTWENEDVDRALDVNANLVRAHGHVLPDNCYERCDSEGLLVWQDLPLTGPGSFNVDRGKTLASLLHDRYARHPSLAAFSVHDDPVQAFTNGLGSGLLSKLRLRWRAWRTSYDPEPAERVGEAFGERRPVFSTVGGPGVGGDAVAYYPGWDYGSPGDVEWLIGRYPAAILAEFGAGTVTDSEDSEDSVEADGGEGEAGIAGFDRSKLDRQVEEPGDSEAYQATLLRTVIEHLRREGVGGIFFCLRDTDRGGMGIYRVDGSPKAARDAVRTLYEPTQAFLDSPTSSTTSVSVINDRMKAMPATLEWTAGDEGGSMDLELTGQGIVTGDSIEIPDDAKRVSLTLETEDGRFEHEYDR